MAEDSVLWGHMAWSGVPALPLTSGDVGEPR